jgi:Ca-activated chloride channel family protein
MSRLRDTTRPAVLSSLFFVMAGSALLSQQEPTFRTGTRTVPVYATVTDADGRLVTDLARDDFEIYDNGKRQEVTVFANEVQPIRVVLMLDRSGSMVGNFTLVQQAAEEFVERLLPHDKARIGSFSNRVQVDPAEFTGDKGELLQILQTQLQVPGPTPLWNAVAVGMTDLLHEDARRVVLVFTDGVDAPGNMSNMNVTLKEATERARREDVMVYAIGLWGRNPTGRRPMGGFRIGGFGFGVGGGRGGGRMNGDPQKPDEGLAKIAAETGGGYFELESTANLGETFARVADELHRQYALGFSPGKLDGKTHKLEVRLVKAGFTVRARRSYYARPERQ